MYDRNTRVNFTQWGRSIFQNKPGNLPCKHGIHPRRSESRPGWERGTCRRRNHRSSTEKGIVCSGRREEEEEEEGERGGETMWMSGGSGLDVWSARGCVFGSLVDYQGATQYKTQCDGGKLWTTLKDTLWARHAALFCSLLFLMTRTLIELLFLARCPGVTCARDTCMMMMMMMMMGVTDRHSHRGWNPLYPRVDWQRWPWRQTATEVHQGALMKNVLGLRWSATATWRRVSPRCTRTRGASRGSDSPWHGLAEECRLRSALPPSPLFSLCCSDWSTGMQAAAAAAAAAAEIAAAPTLVFISRRTARRSCFSPRVIASLPCSHSYVPSSGSGCIWFAAGCSSAPRSFS